MTGVWVDVGFDCGGQRCYLVKDFLDGGHCCGDGRCVDDVGGGGGGGGDNASFFYLFIFYCFFFNARRREENGKK